MADETVILRVQLDSGKVIQDMEKLTKDLISNKDALAELNKARRNGQVDADTFAKKNVELTNTIKAQQRDYNTLAKNLDAYNRSTNLAEGSNDQLRAQLVLNTAAWDKLSQAEKDNSEAGKALQEETKRISDQLSASEQKVDNFRRQVGKYGAGFKGVLDPLIQELVKLQLQEGKLAQGSEALLRNQQQQIGFRTAAVQAAAREGKSYEETTTQIENYAAAIKPTVEQLMLLEQEQVRLVASGEQASESYRLIGFQVAQTKQLLADTPLKVPEVVLPEIKVPTSSLEGLVTTITKIREQQRNLTTDSSGFQELERQANAYRNAAVTAGAAAGLSYEETTAKLGEYAALIQPTVAKLTQLEDEQARIGDIGSEAYRKITFEIAATRKELADLPPLLNETGDGFADFVGKAAGFAGIQLGVESVVDSIRDFGTESIASAKKGSDSISDLEKSLNLTTTEARALREMLGGIDTRTSQENLEGIAVAAGQLGIAADLADEFTQSVDQANVALGDEFTGGVAEVTKSLGGLQKLFKETTDLSPAESISRIGSAVNSLGAEGLASGPVMAEFAARLGQLGALAPSIQNTLGLGAAFQELGLSAEIASGGITNVLLTAAKDTEGFGKQIGLTSDEFAKLLNNDPNEVILRLADSFKGASQTEIIATLDGLKVSSQEATKVVELLASKTDFVREKQALASAEFAKGTSLTDEFAKKNTNAAAEVEKAEKNFAQFRQEFGERLLPVYTRFLQLGGFVLDVLRATPKFVADNRAAFGLLAVALLFYNAAQIKAQAASLKNLALQRLEALGLLVQEAGTYRVATAQTVLNRALTANPIGVIITLLALFAFGLKQLYDRSETFRASVNSLFDILKPLGTLFAGLASQLAPLGAQLGRFFTSLGGGKVILEIFSVALKAGLVVPLKLVATQLQTTVDALMGFWDVGKRVANFFGADFKVDPNGSFDALAENLRRNVESIEDTITGNDVTKAQQAENEKRVLAYQFELERKMRAQIEHNAKVKKQQADAEAALRKQTADAAQAQTAEDLKIRKAQLELQLSQARQGSLEELQLKKSLIGVGRDLELLEEKKTAGDKVVIRSKAQVEIAKLDREFSERTKQERLKLQKEELELQLRNTQEGSDEQLNLKQRLLKNALDTELAAVNLTNGQRLLAQRRYEADSQKLTEESAQKRLVSEIERAKTLVQAELAGVQEGGEQALTLRQQLIQQQLAQDITALDVRKDNTATEALLRANAAKELAEVEFQQSLKYLEDELQARRNRVNQEYAVGTLTKKQQEDSLLAIEKAALQAQLVALKDYGRDATAVQAQIDAQAAAARDKRIADAAEEANKRKAIQDTILDSSATVTQGIIDLFGEESAAGQAALAFKKAFALAEIAINLQRELSAIAAAAAANPANAVTFGGAGISQGTILTALAIAKAAVLTMRVLVFRRGGVTYDPDGQVASGPSHEQGGIPLYSRRTGRSAGIEIEGGEVILTKRITQNKDLFRRASELNVLAGGRPLMSSSGKPIAPSAYMQMGGIATPYVRDSLAGAMPALSADAIGAAVVKELRRGAIKATISDVKAGLGRDEFTNSIANA